MILTTLSDKALLERARRHDEDAPQFAATLLSRWAIVPADPAKTIEGWRGLKILSVTAAKRVALTT